MNLVMHVDIKIFRLPTLFYFLKWMMQGYFDEHCKTLRDWRESSRGSLFEACCCKNIPCGFTISSSGGFILFMDTWYSKKFTLFLNLYIVSEDSVLACGDISHMHLLLVVCGDIFRMHLLLDQFFHIIEISSSRN